MEFLSCSRLLLYLLCPSLREGVASVTPSQNTTMPCSSSLGKKEETITKPLLQSPRSCMLMPQVSKGKGNQFEGGGGKSTGSYRLGWHTCPDLNHEGIWETEEKHSCLCGTEEHPGIVTQQWVWLADRASNPSLPDSWIYGSPNHAGVTSSPAP